MTSRHFKSTSVQQISTLLVPNKTVNADLSQSLHSMMEVCILHANSMAQAHPTVTLQCNVRRWEQMNNQAIWLRYA